MAVIAAIIADSVDRPVDPELPNFACQLSLLGPADLGSRDLADALAV